MKTSLKFLIPLCVLSFSLAPLTRAADEPAPQTPVPASPDTSDTAPTGKGKRPRGQAMEQMKEMKEKLNLTADQETKVKDIYKSHMAELKSAKGDRSAMAEVIKKQREEVRAILTPDQQKTFDTMGAGARTHKKKDKTEA